MLRRSLAVGMTLLLLAGSIVQAQDQQRRGRGRGGFGFGLRGFGRGGGFGGAGTSTLVGIPEVQKELKIDGDQKALLDDLLLDLRDQMRELWTGIGFGEDLTQEERQDRMEQAREKSEDIGKKGEEMVAMILEPTQMERVNQLQLQREGIQAFARPEVAKKIGLTEEQRDKMSLLRDEVSQQMRQAFQGFQGFRDLSSEERREAFAKMREQREKMEQDRKKIDGDIFALLTSEQKEIWTKMKGKEFKFPERRRRGGRGNRGGQRRRRPQRPSDDD